MIIKKLFHTMINIHKKNKVIEQKPSTTKKVQPPKLEQNFNYNE